MLGHSAGFSSGWQINTKGAAVSNVMLSLVGVTLAIIASLLPWPILLIRRAQVGADVLTANTLNLWSRAVKVFLAEGNQDYEKDGMETDRDGLQASVGNLGYQIENSWWECLGLGAWQRSRAAMATYRQYMLENHDRIPSVLFACAHNDQEQSHFDLMNPLKAQIEELMAHSQLLYQKATVAAVAGGIATEEEYNSMMDTKAKTDESISAFARAFQKTKTDLGLPMVNSDQMDEHCFCFNLCSHARIACSLADEFIGAWKKGGGFGAADIPSLFSVFDTSVICDPGHVSFTVRNGITLIVCFIVGYFGFPPPHESLIKPGNGGPACTAAILLSTFRPSMVKKSRSSQRRCPRQHRRSVGLLFARLLHLVGIPWYLHRSLGVGHRNSLHVLQLREVRSCRLSPCCLRVRSLLAGVHQRLRKPREILLRHR